MPSKAHIDLLLLPSELAGPAHVLKMTYDKPIDAIPKASLFVSELP